VICLEGLPSLEPFLTAKRAAPECYADQLALAVILLERETYYTALYGADRASGAEPPAEHDRFWQTFPATAAGREALGWRRQLSAGAGPPPPLDLFGLKAEALAGLEATLRPRSSHVTGALLAAAFAIDLEEHARAVAAAERVLQRSPSHRGALAFSYTALTLAADRDRAFSTRLRAAEKRARTAFGTSWMNALVRALDRHTLEVRRLAWRLRTDLEGDRFTRFLKTEGQFCEDARAHAMANFAELDVPEALRELTPLARQLGVGDDPCRAHFLRRMSPRERRAALRVAEPLVSAVQDWISHHERGAMPAEVAAFFWLLEALEEMRTT
jgi:hypothetical protein